MLFDTTSIILLCLSISTNRYVLGKPYFQYQMGIHRSIGYIVSKFKNDKTFNNFDQVSDNGKGKGYGILSLKLHSFSSFALDQIDKIKYEQLFYINRLLITHPIGDMTKYLLSLDLKPDDDFYLEDSTNTSNIYPGNLLGIRDTILKTTGGFASSTNIIFSVPL